MIAARSSAYTAKLIVSLDVPNRGSKNIRKRYGLSVSPCIVLLCIDIGFIFPKCSPVNMVLEFE